MKPFAVALMGPTASGKTELSVRLAKQLNGEIVSVDSALVYRGLNIGAANPSVEEQQGVTHWLIDVRDPAEPFSVAEFCSQAKLCISDIVSRDKTPILAGGTMMYFKALLQGLSDMPKTNQKVRDEIEAHARQLGWPAMHSKLAEVDPVSSAKIHPNHSQRISRALEVWHTSGKPMSEWQTGFEGGILEQYSWRQLAIAPSDRSVLHDRIARRFESMVAAGFIEEVAVLRERPDLHKDLPAIRAVGYRQVWEYLDGDYGLDDCKRKVIAATRQLAKRQLTWLRSWGDLQWCDTLDLRQKLKDITQLEQECLSFCVKSTI